MLLSLLILSHKRKLYVCISYNIKTKVETFEHFNREKSIATDQKIEQINSLPSILKVKKLSNKLEKIENFSLIQ